MGQGIDLARDISPEHAQAIDDMKDQLLIVLVKRLGGDVCIPATEIDSTGQDIMSMYLDPDTRVFRFIVGRKQ